MADEEEKNILIVIIDTNPVWLGERILKHERDLVLSQFLDSVLVFCNSYLMVSQKNVLGVIATHANSSRFLYPKEGPADEINEDRPSEKDGKYELFARLDDTVKEEICDMILNDVHDELHSDSLIAGAMGIGLCYINRIMKDVQSESEISSRILVIKGSKDNPSQYLNFMNVVFTAQKHNVMIDACILDNDSGLLQQACDLTGGIYLKIPQLAGLMQYLLWLYLPDQSIRHSLTLPPKVKVDYRAACFCHRNLIDIGYVCSVCLSIFCNFSPICSTCKTTFKFLGPPKSLKRKEKKMP